MQQLRPYHLTNTTAQTYARRRGIGQLDTGYEYIDPTTGEPYLTYVDVQNALNAAYGGPAPYSGGDASVVMKLTGPGPTKTNWLPMAGLAILVLVLLSGGHR